MRPVIPCKLFAHQLRWYGWWFAQWFGVEIRGLLVTMRASSLLIPTIRRATRPLHPLALVQNIWCIPARHWTTPFVSKIPARHGLSGCVARHTFADLDHSKIQLLVQVTRMYSCTITTVPAHPVRQHPASRELDQSGGLSQGFISFRIYPQPDLPNSTVVNNHAAIIFDNNAPIITNNVWRTYGKYFLVSTNEEINPQRVRVSVSPESVPKRGKV